MGLTQSQAKLVVYFVQTFFFGIYVALDDYDNLPY